MQFGAEAVATAPVVFAGQIHRRERREAELHPRAPREQRRLDVERAVLASEEIESEGACRRLAVEQRIEGRVIAALLRRFDPEFAEERKALVIGAGVDAERARRKAIFLVAAEKAEIARAEEGDHLVVDMRLVERKMQAKAGEAGVDGERLLELEAAIVEERRRIGNGRRDAVADRVHRHRAPIEKAEMKRLQPEAAVRAREDVMVALEANLSPGVEVQSVERLRQARRNRSVEGRQREVARPLHHVLEAESRRWERRRRASAGPLSANCAPIAESAPANWRRVSRVIPASEPRSCRRTRFACCSSRHRLGLRKKPAAPAGRWRPTCHHPPTK